MGAKRSDVILWTDGSCLKGGYGGIGVYLIYGKHEKRFGEGYPDTTNNQMEMLAVIKGLQMLKYTCNVQVFSDSQYVIKGATEWFKGWERKGWITQQGKPVKNKDLWQKLVELNRQHTVTYTWVKGHNGTEGNEIVDKLAREAAEELKNEQ